MKKILSLILVSILLYASASAQDFALTNPVMTPNPGVYPGGTETVSFNFSVSQNYTFSSNPVSNNYGYITFSFTKLNPTAAGPAGTGAALFNWTLTNNGGTGVNRVYTWTGTTKDVTMLAVPNAYQILFTNVPITAPATPAETDIRVAGQFTDPGNAPTGLTGNNSAVIATYTASGGPLPIRLVSFDGVKMVNKVLLKWQTTSELNSKYFDVEFSENGTTWNSIGTVNAAGTSTTGRSYTLPHNSPVNGVNYYRLKQVDVNSNFSYSSIITINFAIKGVNINSVYPNPFVNQLKIDVSSDRSESVSIQLSDNMGRVLKVQNSSIQKGVNKLVLDNLAGLAPGIYNVEVKTAYSSYRFKLKK
ncbi:MAG TPA: T9SS type A sorting domain-containing protein [Chitinophagaceae bacterium]|nr:T9SS type A sorting domain-containing protein [Chitinophagaceae bacterium]